MPTIAEAMSIAASHHQAGRLQEAELIYGQIVAADPNNSEAWHRLGGIAGQCGDRERAIACFDRALERQSNSAELHSDLGTALQMQGKYTQAVRCFRRAIAILPEFAALRFNLGNALAAAGDKAGAVAAYRRATELQPIFAEAHYNLGTILKDLGRYEEAVACFGRTLALRPDFAEAYGNLGIALQELGKFDEAVDCYRQSLTINPNNATTHNNLGNAFKERLMLDEAIACYQQAMEVNPADAEAHFNVGTVRQIQGKLDAALASYGRALEINPSLARAHHSRGTIFHALEKADEAIACYQQAISLQPDFAAAHCHLGVELQRQGRLDEAIRCYRRSLELNSDYSEAEVAAAALTNMGNAFKDQAKVEKAIDCYRKAIDISPDSGSAYENLLYALYFSPDQDATSIFEEHRRWEERHARSLAKVIPPHRNTPAADRRLRVGYVSPDFRNHVQALFTVPLLAAHDHQQCEIFCYSDVAARDGITDWLRSYAEVWRATNGLSDEHLAQIVREDQIDVLVDLTMHMAGGRPLLFARKPAPVQICWLAYPGTTGLTAIDYRLTDPYLDPAGLDDRFYSEQSIRLPETFWCYDPFMTQPAVGPLPALERGHVTFGSLNNFCKINAGVLRLWARVLNAVELSRLVLLAPQGSARQWTLALLEQEGISADRVTFFDKRPRRDYLALYHQIDIGLDTFPYNGHTTSLDAYWMGVPIVTLRGQMVVGRAGVSQLTNLGLSELIAETPDQFVGIAVGLARDLDRLSPLRASLRQRMQRSPLMDAPRFARHVESVYRSLWQRWCSQASR